MIIDKQLLKMIGMAMMVRTTSVDPVTIQIIKRSNSMLLNTLISSSY